jgi:hypothetical protein
MSSLEVVLSIAATGLLVVGLIHFLHDMRTGCKKFLRHYQVLLVLALFLSFGSCLLFPKQPGLFVTRFLENVGPTGYILALGSFAIAPLFFYYVARNRYPITDAADLKITSPLVAIATVGGIAGLAGIALYPLGTDDYLFQAAIWVIFATALTFPVALFAPLMTAWVDVTTLMHQFGFETFEGYTLATALRFLGLDESIDHYVAAIAFLSVVLLGDFVSVFDDPQV